MNVHTITLLRHGESEGNFAEVLQGQSDYPLTPTGLKQAQRLAQFWKSQEVKFDLITSSPLLRASQTAEIIAKALQTPLKFDPDWMERNMGCLQGMNLQDIEQQVPPIDFFQPYEPLGGTGESQMELYSRACRVIQKIIRQPPGSYLVVSHGGILNQAIFVILGITPQGHYNSPIIHLGNTGYAQFRYNSASRQWAVMSLNNRASREHAEGQFSWKTD